MGKEKRFETITIIPSVLNSLLFLASVFWMAEKAPITKEIADTLNKLVSMGRSKNRAIYGAQKKSMM